jgi:DMSO/TMAO reductase YedYZ molybdopterin-dependent catalytic subunit
MAGTAPEDRSLEDDGDVSLIAAAPAPPTMSRRGALALIGGSSLVVFILTAGQTIRTLRPLSLLSPRTQSDGSGPNAFQVNRTAQAAGISADATGVSWRLQLVAAATGRTVELSRSDLMSMPLTTADLPIACVEGWSTVQRWTGVPLAALARVVGVSRPTGARVESIERNSAFAAAMLSGDQVRASASLLALVVNGADLSMDHGYPARTIIPAAPGVHNTKWVARIYFEGDVA